MVYWLRRQEKRQGGGEGGEGGGRGGGGGRGSGGSGGSGGSVGSVGEDASWQDIQKDIQTPMQEQARAQGRASSNRHQSTLAFIHGFGLGATPYTSFIEALDRELVDGTLIG